MPQTLPRIWIITEPNHPSGLVPPIRRALEACPTGVVGVQLRAKQAPDRQLVTWGRELRAITESCGALLSINRRIDVAEIVEADGVHLPELGLPLADLRCHWPAIRVLGVSRHDRQGLQAAERDGASYSFLSPVFEVPGKGPAMGLEGFRSAIVDVGMPTYALGGLDSGHVEPVIAAGGYGLAVRRAIYGADRPEAALAALLHELDKCLSTGE